MEEAALVRCVVSVLIGEGDIEVRHLWQLPLVGVFVIPLGEVELFIEVVCVAGMDLGVNGHCGKLILHDEYSARFFIGVNYSDPLCAHDGLYCAGVCDSEPLSFGASTGQCLVSADERVVHVCHGVLHPGDGSARRLRAHSGSAVLELYFDCALGWGVDGAGVCRYLASFRTRTVCTSWALRPPSGLTQVFDWSAYLSAELRC